MTAKTENYTAEMTADLVERYGKGETVEVLAEAFGKSAKSIVAKLVREQVYKSKAAVAGKGHKMTKLVMLEKVEERFGMAKGTLASMEKATVAAVEALMEATAETADASADGE